MLVYSFIYMILAIYIERINPGEFGISQPWNYLCKKGDRKSPQASAVKQTEINKNKDKVESNLENNRWIESSSLTNTKLPVLSINHMTKKFGKLNAVMDLSLDFYNGEVCSLLGHNGAGKTTTTFILVDILYNELSVREHLKLVAEMRQMRQKEAEESIDNILNLIGLVDQQHTWAKNLSGVFHRNHNHIIGFYLTWIRLFTLIIKRWILSRRQIFVLLGFLLGPLLIEIITISALPSPKDIQASLLQNERIKDAQVTLIPSIYNPQTIVIYSNETDNQIKGYLRNYLTNMGANIDEITTNDITDYVLSRNNDSYDTYVNKYQMGFSIDRSSTSPTLNVFFSTVNYHTMATGLSVATTCLFQYYANSSSKSIQTINQPILTYSESVTARAIFYDRIYCFDTVPLSLLNFINGVIASIFISILVLNVIRERISHSKDLQLLTNTSKKLYWFSNFLYDLTLCLIISALLTIVVKIGSVAHPNSEVEVHIYQGTEQIGYFFLLYVMYSLTSLPFVYSYSFIPESELIGFIMFLIANVLACFFDMVLGFIAVFSQASPSSSPDQMSTTTQVMLILRSILAGFFPTVNFKQALFNIRLRSDATCVTAINSIMITNYSPDEPWTSIDQPGIGLQLVIFSAQTVFWWTILACIENRVKIGQSVCCCCLNRKELKTINRKRKQMNGNDSTIALEWDDSKLDKDVRDERRIILNNRELSTSAVVLVRDLVQQFKKRKGKSLFSPYFTAVDHLNFYVSKQSCFGLLGIENSSNILILDF
ncbi:unnamed protein product [Rotaria sp. Silwood2]|nr:unnamed protein product [Rotaria sp. Silwood2]